MTCLFVVCCSPPVHGFAFDRHSAFGMQPCAEEAMDTMPIVRPPSVTGGSQGTTNTSSRLQPVTVAMDESDGTGGVVPLSGGDIAARQSKSDQFLLPQPGVRFQPTAYAPMPCHVISQQPFSSVVPMSGGGVPVPSMPVSVPCYTVRQLPPSQPLVQPQVYYRPADGFCVTTPAARSALEEPQYGSEHL